MRVLCIYFLEETCLPIIAEACLRFSPQIALGQQCVFVEIGACNKLYTEESVLMRTQVLLKRFEKKARLSVADDVPTALARAIYQIKERESSAVSRSLPAGPSTSLPMPLPASIPPSLPASLPIEALRIFSSPFRDSDSLDKMILCFRQLGIHFIGDLVRLPRRSLLMRFGKESLTALYRVESAKDILWPKFVPTEKIAEEESIDEFYEICNLEPLLFILRAILDRVVLRLRGRSQIVSSFKLTIVLEKFSTVSNCEREWCFDLAMPQGTAMSILPIIRDKLNLEFQHQPLQSSVRQIKLEVLRSVAAQHRQLNFFSNKEEDLESFRSVVARLVGRLGFNRAFLASPTESYFPERSWQKTLNSPAYASNKIPQRPLRVLKSPVLVRFIEHHIVHPTRKWKVQFMDGPERISGDWWCQDKERDYYRVSVDTGEELWIFAMTTTKAATTAATQSVASIAHSNVAVEYFLHGIFD